MPRYREANGVSFSEAPPISAALVQRLVDAINRHALDDLVACFATDVLSETPAHPERSFRGNEQVRKNWSHIFSTVPDLRAVPVRSAVDGDRLWVEWDWSGTRDGGAPQVLRGVTILGVREDRFSSVRFYMEPVRADGLDPDAAVRQVVEGERDL